MPEEMRTYVLQNETKGWLRSRERADLAKNFEESFFDRRSRRREGKEEKSLDRIRENKGNEAAVALVGKGTASLFSVQCYNCRKRGHFQTNCPEPLRKGDPRDSSHGDSEHPEVVGKVALLDALDKVKTPKVFSHENDTVRGLTWVKLQVGENQLNACLDSGAGIIVLSLGALPSGYSAQSKENAMSLDILHLLI